MKSLGPMLTTAFVLFFATSSAFADTGDLHEEGVEEDLQEQEEGGASPEDIRRAQEFFDKGAQLYYEGEYSRAAVEFRRAHEAHPHPVFLHNIAVMNMRLDRMEAARDAARGVLDMDERLPPQQDARNWGILRGADASFAGEAVAEAIDAAAAAAVADAEAEEADAEDEEMDQLEGPPVVADDSGFGTMGLLGVGSVAVGVASIVGGVVVHSQIQDDQALYEIRHDRHPESQTVAELGDHISSQQTQRLLFFGAGGALTAVGATLIVLGARSGSSDSGVALTVPVDRPGLSASFRW